MLQGRILEGPNTALLNENKIEANYFFEDFRSNKPIRVKGLKKTLEPLVGKKVSVEGTLQSDDCFEIVTVTLIQ